MIIKALRHRKRVTGLTQKMTELSALYAVYILLYTLSITGIADTSESKHFRGEILYFMNSNVSLVETDGTFYMLQACMQGNVFYKT